MRLFCRFNKQINRIYILNSLFYSVLYIKTLSLECILLKLNVKGTSNERLKTKSRND
jgi:hypothetical protein